MFRDSLGELKKRYWKLLDDDQDLYNLRPIGTFPWEGYQIQFRGKQVALRKALKIAEKMGCYNYRARAWPYATRSTCRKMNMIFPWIEMSDAEIAEIWIDDIKNNRTEGDGIVILARIPYDDAERTWTISLEILRLLSDDEKLLIAAVGSGTLETLLNRHGDAFVDRYVEFARRDSRFREAASAIWPGGILDDVWERLQSVIQPSDVRAQKQALSVKNRDRKRQR